MRLPSIASRFWLMAMALPAWAATVPVDNPVATFYVGPEGYPAWTDKIAWANVIDMAAYGKGATEFERFEKARDELAAKGGGVLYYRAGTYDFSDGPFDGPDGRGLMLKTGVVIRGETPSGHPVASERGALELGTKFVFGFQKRAGHDVPRDWNIIGLTPDSGAGPESVRNVGVAWVHITGGTVFFGPALKWGDTWATAKSWKSAYVKSAWADRKPDGTHPTDGFMGAPGLRDGGGYVMGARGRLVFGCALRRAALLNNYQTCGRRETPEGYGPDGFHMAKFAARIAAYGSRVFVANNLLAKTEEGNFLYGQTTVRTIAGKGNSFSIGAVRTNSVMWDYNRVMGIDVNKDMLGMVGHTSSLDRKGGYFEEGVTIRDNWVFNHGHKGYNVSGRWATIRNNKNDRYFLKGGAPVLGVEAGWRLTLDGFIESSGGGGGAVSDNLARAFDVAGEQMWIGDNVYNNTGSSPGNDGEGICCQAHGGTHITSWAITCNRQEIGPDGGGGKGLCGGYRVNCRGLLVGWNETQGYAGARGPGDDSADVAIVGNWAAQMDPHPETLWTGLQARVIYMPEGRPLAPSITSVKMYEDDAVEIMWEDRSGKPWKEPEPEPGRPRPTGPTPIEKRRGQPQQTREMGFRVDRKIEEGPWYTIAFRPPQTVGHPMNLPAWVDFTAPRGKRLVYRVMALSGHPDLGGVSPPSRAIVIERKGGQPLE